MKDAIHNSTKQGGATGWQIIYYFIVSAPVPHFLSVTDSALDLAGERYILIYLMDVENRMKDWKQNKKKVVVFCLVNAKQKLIFLVLFD